MCFAIAPENQSRHGRFHHHWMRVASSPLRLLGTGALVQVVFLAVFGMCDLLPETSRSAGALQFVLIYGIVGSLILGLLLSWLALQFNRQPVHYAVYVVTCFLMFTGMWLVAVGMYAGGGWMTAGAVSVLLAWVIALRALWWIAIWVWGPSGAITRVLMSGCVTAMAGIPLFIAWIHLESSWLLYLLLMLELLVLNAIAVVGIFVYAHDRRTRMNLLNQVLPDPRPVSPAMSGSLSVKSLF